MHFALSKEQAVNPKNSSCVFVDYFRLVVGISRCRAHIHTTPVIHVPQYCIADLVAYHNLKPIQFHGYEEDL